MLFYVYTNNASLHTKIIIQYAIVSIYHVMKTQRRLTRRQMGTIINTIILEVGDSCTAYKKLIKHTYDLPTKQQVNKHTT